MLPPPAVRPPTRFQRICGRPTAGCPGIGRGLFQDFSAVTDNWATSGECIRTPRLSRWASDNSSAQRPGFEFLDGVGGGRWLLSIQAKEARESDFRCVCISVHSLRISSCKAGVPGQFRATLFPVVPAQQYVGKFLMTFKEVPPSQKSASFNLDSVMEQLPEGPSGSH